VERGDRQIPSPVPQKSASHARFSALTAGNATSHPTASGSNEAALSCSTHPTATAINSVRATRASAPFDDPHLRSAGTAAVEPRLSGAIAGDAVRCNAANDSNRRGRSIRHRGRCRVSRRDHATQGATVRATGSPDRTRRHIRGDAKVTGVTIGRTARLSTARFSAASPPYARFRPAGLRAALGCIASVRARSVPGTRCTCVSRRLLRGPRTAARAGQTAAPSAGADSAGCWFREPGHRRRHRVARG
jgi:hypothetical protein